jgi:hypothetical protein
MNLNGYDELGTMATVGGHELHAKLVLDMDLDLPRRSPHGRRNQGNRSRSAGKICWMVPRALLCPCRQLVD